MLVCGAVTGRLLAFGAVTVRLCWFLAQLLGDHVGLRASYWKIILIFYSVAVRLQYVHDVTSTGSNSLSPQGQGLDSSSVHVGFVVDKVVLGQFFFRVLQTFSACIIPPIIHPHSLTF